MAQTDGTSLINWPGPACFVRHVNYHRHTSRVTVYSQYLPSPATLVGREGPLHPAARG